MVVDCNSNCIVFTVAENCRHYVDLQNYTKTLSQKNLIIHKNNLLH